MLGFDSFELLIIAVVAMVVVGPKDLPRVMRGVGSWVGKARGFARHFRTGFDAMVREAELEEMEKKWRAENERIMRQYPQTPPASTETDWGKAPPAGDPPPQPGVEGPAAPAQPSAQAIAPPRAPRSPALAYVPRAPRAPSSTELP